MPSGLKTAPLYIVVCAIINYLLLLGHWVVVDMTRAFFDAKSRNTQKSAHSSVWQTCKMFHPWVLFRKTTVYILFMNTYNTKI